MQSTRGRKLPIWFESRFRQILVIYFRTPSAPGPVPKKCRAPTCTCLSQTGASLARHFPRWGALATASRGKARTKLWLAFGNLLGITKVESDLNPPFAGFWQSTFAQHLHHGEPDKNVVQQHAPVWHRQVRVWHDIFQGGGPWRLQAEARPEPSFGWL